MSKKAFWLPYLVLWEAIIAVVLNIVWYDQCPAEFDGHKYSLFSCGSLVAVVVSFCAVIVLQLMAAMYVNKYIDPDYHSSLFLLQVFCFLTRVNYDFDTSKLEERYLKLALEKTEDDMSCDETKPDVEKSG